MTGKKCGLALLNNFLQNTFEIISFITHWVRISALQRMHASAFCGGGRRQSESVCCLEICRPSFWSGRQCSWCGVCAYDDEPNAVACREHDDFLELRDARSMSGQQRSSFDSHEHDSRDAGGGCHGRLNSVHRSLDLRCPRVSNVAQGKILYHNRGINK